MRGQHQHDKNEVGADKSGDYAETGDRGAGWPEIGCLPAREEERNGRGRGTPAGRDEEVCCARATAKPFGSVVPAIRPHDAATWCAGPHRVSITMMPLRGKIADVRRRAQNAGKPYEEPMNYAVG